MNAYLDASKIPNNFQIKLNFRANVLFVLQNQNLYHFYNLEEMLLRFWLSLSMVI